MSIETQKTDPTLAEEQAKILWETKETLKKAKKIIPLSTEKSQQDTKELYEAAYEKLYNDPSTKKKDKERLKIVKENDLFKSVQWEKISFSKEYITIGDLKIARQNADMDDVTNIEGIKPWVNVFKNPGGESYFTLDAVEKLQTAGKRIPTFYQWAQMAQVMGSVESEKGIISEKIS